MANLNFNGIIRGGVLRNMQILGFGANPTPTPPGPTPLQVSSSVRFNPADTPSFGYVPTLQGSRTTFTFSAWVKRSLLGAAQTIFGQNTDTSNHGFIEFLSNDTLRVSSNLSGTAIVDIRTTAVYRDPSQWYNVVVVFDFTNATQADRVRLFVNGVRVTAFSTSTLPANTTSTTTFNTSGVQHYIGRYAASSIQYFGGYMADINLVDGQALTPAAFTETDSDTGQLIPMTYAGSYGVNGFYLPFGNSATVAELGFNTKTTAQDYPYWPYNSLLVNSSSANGAQNNTFLDSSTNNFTITRAGNTTQGRFGPFEPGGGTTQANGYYSGFFDGTGDFLVVPSNTALTLSGSFTLEAWVYKTTTALGGIICQDDGASSSQAFQFRVNNITLEFIYWTTSSRSSAVGVSSSVSVVLNQWTHVAATYNGTNLRLFVNGQLGYTSGTLGSIFSMANAVATGIGNYNTVHPSANIYLTGYLSNVRIIKGTAQYTANFTVPTTPLTAVTNTQLLTCQSSQFIDNSANAFAITTVGNSQPVPTNPFGMTAWSGAFDGTGDYLDVPSSAALALGTSDFTIELWVWYNSHKNYTELVDGRGGVNTAVRPTLYSDSAGTILYYNDGANRITGATVPTNAWIHVALTRSGTSTKLFINGIQSGSTYTDASNYTQAAWRIGSAYNAVSADATNYSLNGFISNVRVIKGTALYTANFTVPTAPLTAVTNTQLLTCQSSTFVDNSPNAFTITPVGSTYTFTLNNPFGNPINYTTPPAQSWSTYFDGSGDYISSPAGSPAYAMGTGNWTWESWAYSTLSGSSTNQVIWAYYTTNVDNFLPYFLTSTNTFNVTLRATNLALTTLSSPSNTIRANQWHHLVVTRDSATNISMYVNGIKVAALTIASNVSFADTVMNTSNGINPTIGAQTNLVRDYFYGYISNLRFVRGSAVYTSNFTPPTSPLTAIPGTMTLACQSNQVRDNSLLNVAQVTNGNTQISPLTPFIPITAWTAASNGGSMYFDGTGDALTADANTALDLTGDFTIDFWAYAIDTTTNYICNGTQSGSGCWRFTMISSTGQVIWSLAINSWAGVNISSSTNVFKIGTWNHFAITRNGNVHTVYVNGISVATTTVAGSLVNTGRATQIGYYVESGGIFYSKMYLASLRIIKGTALYTTPFVPPVLPPTAVTNTQLLLNATNAGVYDATGINNIETVGNAQVSTAVKKWGESSVYFDGSGDYLVVPPRVELYLSGSQTTGTNKDFTIECWIYPTTISYPNTFAAIATKRGSTGSASGYILSVNSSGALSYAAGDSNTAGWEVNFSSSNGAIAANNWYHVAVTRLGTTFRMFINGTQVATATPTAFVIAYDITGSLFIGLNAGESPLYPWYGYLQDFRYTIGAARYQGAFTPPTAAFAYNQYDICNQQWTPTNLSVTAGVNQDNLVDSPSDYGTDTGAGGQVKGNYATWNPLSGIANGTLSNGNLDFVGVADGASLRHATMGIASGKWYAEITVTSALSSAANLGIALYSQSAIGTVNASQSRGYYYDGQKYSNGTLSAYGNSYTNGDIIGIAVDADSGKVWFSKNGTWQNSGSPTAGTNAAFTDITGTTWFISIQTGGSTGSAASSVNFGQRAFAYTAPTDFKCLVSTNLPVTNSIGASSSTQASKYFNPVLYTGNGSTQSIANVGFQPDFVWVKNRSTGGTNHRAFDAVRGASSVLYPSLTNAQATDTTGLTSFDSNGFSLGSTQVNDNSNNYVAWNWNAGGANATNTNGSITSTVRASTTFGFSIATFTTQSSGTATVGHGLGTAPQFFIIKTRSVVDSWNCYHESIGAANKLFLNTTAASTATSDWNSTAPTSTVITLGSPWVGSYTAVGYFFAAIPGFSAFGVYTGNGSATQGPFIYTGFRPAYVLIKRNNGTASWVVFDDARNTSNLTTQILLPNLADAEITGVGTVLDLVSNGFLPRNAGAEVNASGATYVYAAFAEFPFKYARAR